MASVRALQALAAPKRSVKQAGVIGSEAERRRSFTEQLLRSTATDEDADGGGEPDRGGGGEAVHLRSWGDHGEIMGRSRGDSPDAR